MNLAVQRSLFATCALPGCSNPVSSWGEACPDCVSAFAGFLRPAGDDQPALTEQDLVDRDGDVAQARDCQRAIAAGAALGTTAAVNEARDQPDRRRNQTCWLCEQRRTCCRMPQGWECDACRQVS